MRKILLLGSNGRLGSVIAKYLSKKYNLFCMDVGESITNVSEYYQFKNYDDLKSLYSQNDFYAIIHCQQVKSTNFINARLDNISIEEFNKVLSANLELTLFSTQFYLNTLKNKKSLPKGRIINFSSTYSTISSNPNLYDGTEMGNPVHYTISKGGVSSLTKYVAAYYRDYGVLCNSISPHGIENNQSIEFSNNFSHRSPIGRLSVPEETIPAIEFLLDEKNTYVNGANIPVDGGWTAC